MTHPKPTLLIGDCHGHYDRLRYLLEQQNIINSAEVRTNFDVEVIQLGDLGHFGGAAGSPTGDQLCYQMAPEWFDKVLWGNHDYAVFHSNHAFAGFEMPSYETKELMAELHDEGKLVLTAEAHGFFLSHAGLHSQWKHQKVPCDKQDPKAVSEYLNRIHESGETDGNHAVWDAIGRKRGGYSPFGGILWRDASESLYQGFPQVFGHSKGDKIREYWAGKGQHQWSYCVDLGTKHNGRLGGIWLPDQRKVEIKI